MDLWLSVLILIFGFIFLVKGADFFVSSSSSIARKLNVTPLVIGLTLVAFGTSLPELAVSFIASLSVDPGATADMAMGNVVGSNIVNITLILGLTALTRPIRVSKTMYRKEFPYLIFSSILVTCLAFWFQSDTKIVFFEALLMLLCFLGYIILMLKTSKTDDVLDDVKIFNTKQSIFLLMIGLLGVTSGGWMVTRGAESLALDLLVNFVGMSATQAITLVGLTIVAVGTSLPEMVTSIVAAKKGENEIAYGNLIGSNIFNVLFILGLSGLFSSLGVNPDVMFDMWIMIGVTLVAVIASISFGHVSKKEGLLLTMIYLMYVAFIIVRSLGML